MVNFDEEDMKKSYTWSEGNDDETVTIAKRSIQLGRKLHARTKTASYPGLNIAPAKDTSIISGLPR